MLYLGMRLLPIFIILYLLLAAPAKADQLQIDSNSIHLQTQQLTPLPSSSIKNKPSPIVAITSGLEHTPSSRISLSISPDTLIFDPLSPTNPLLRNATVVIGGQAASLFIYETRPLQADTTKTIPPTSCDNGLCDITNPEVWSNNLTFGFGYRCEDIDSSQCNPIFSELNSYSNIPQSISMLSPWIMQHKNATTVQAQMLYKINIPASQPAGMYSSTIRYVLIPSL